MGLPLLTCSTTRVAFSSSSLSSSSSSSWFKSSDRSYRHYESPASSRSELRKRSGKRSSLSLEKSRGVKASSSGQSSGEVIDDGDAAAAARSVAVPSGDVTSVGSFGSGVLAGPSGEVTSVGEFVGGSGGDWDKIGAVVRLSYGIGESTRW